MEESVRSYPCKAARLKCAGKFFVVFFFDAKGVVYRHVFRRSTVTAAAYVKILATFRDAVNPKRPHIRDGRWLFYHDNAPVNTAGKVLEFLHRNNMQMVPHPLYSPDLALCDFFLFSTIKRPLHGRRFSNDNKLMQAVGDVTREIEKDGLLHVFYKLSARLRKCIEIGGGYVENES